MRILIDHDPATGRVFATYPLGSAAPVQPGYTRREGPVAAVSADAKGVETVNISLLQEAVEMWQARAALKAAGRFEAADLAVKASGNQALQAAWEYGNRISRASPGMAALGAALGLTSAEIDQLFRSAALIAV